LRYCRNVLSKALICHIGSGNGMLNELAKAWTSFW